MAPRSLAGLITTPARYKHFFGYSHQWASGAAAAAVTAAQVGAVDQLLISGDADFLWIGDQAQWTRPGGGQLKLQYNIADGKNYHQAPLFLAGVLDNFYPHYFPQATVIPRGSLFKAILDDRQTVALAATVRVLHIGQKLFPRQLEPARAYEKSSWFRYVADFTAEGIGALTASRSFPTAINIGADADFEIWKMGIVMDVPDATIDIVSSYSGMGWFNVPCHVANLGAGAFDRDPTVGGWPFRLPIPSFLPAGGALQVAVSDLSGATNRCQVIFEGRKLEPPGGLPVDPSLFQNFGADSLLS